ncbi:MAG: AsmA-like C-terminal region-containing protein [Verrucomicrobiota bacterium]|jgi:hypothetical protein|nr:AsmA-like C-terminal region-containing protein [Verrucomicrobiota bacterium]
MKTILRLLLWFLLVLAVLAVAAHFTLRYALNTPKFKAALTGFIERSTGRRFDYERMDYRLIPLSLVIRQAEFKEKDSEINFASIQTFSARINLRQKELSSLVLASPSIRVVQYADGSFNFSDLLSKGDGPDATSPGATAPTPRPTAEATERAEPAELPDFMVRLIEVKDARFEFLRVDETGATHALELTNLHLNLHEFTPSTPLRLDGRVKIGRSSTFDFNFSSGALNAWMTTPAEVPLELAATLKIEDFADIRAFLPAEALPFRSLAATLSTRGTMAGGLAMVLDVDTPDPTEAHPVAIRGRLSPTLSLPAAVVKHLATGAPLPASMQTAFEACEAPEGTLSLLHNGMTVLLLRHLTLSTQAHLPLIAYGQNRFTDGEVNSMLTNGQLTVSGRIRAYEGAISFDAQVQTLACPLAYTLSSLTASNLSLTQMLADNGLSIPSSFSGTAQVQVSAMGTAIFSNAFRSRLAANASLRLNNLQRIGNDGSVLDQLWIQLDNPVLLNLAPKLQPKVEQARKAISTITTTRYEDVTADIHLQQGRATLSNVRMEIPNYRIEAEGTLLPFEQTLDLNARVLLSAEETARLTNGKDRSTYLPYENGGLVIPFHIRGALTKPAVVPDLQVLLKNAAAGVVREELAPQLQKHLSDSDRKNIETGLQILQELGNRLQGRE